MAPQSQQIKDNFVNHPYTQKANQFLSGQVNQLDSEVSCFYFLTCHGVIADIQLNKYPVLRDLETKTKVPKAYGVLALGAS
jgi:receptor expression-enhancing protein 5/6